MPTDVPTGPDPQFFQAAAQSVCFLTTSCIPILAHPCPSGREVDPGWLPVTPGIGVEEQTPVGFDSDVDPLCASLEFVPALAVDVVVWRLCPDCVVHVAEELQGTGDAARLDHGLYLLLSEEIGEGMIRYVCGGPELRYNWA